jgi:hypothetical protein
VDGWWTEIEAEIRAGVRLHPTVTLENRGNSGKSRTTSRHVGERDGVDPARADGTRYERKRKAEFSSSALRRRRPRHGGGSGSLLDRAAAPDTEDQGPYRSPMPSSRFKVLAVCAGCRGGEVMNFEPITITAIVGRLYSRSNGEEAGRQARMISAGRLDRLHRDLLRDHGPAGTRIVPS